MRSRPRLVLGTLVSLSALTPVADGDIFWHLAAGREMWRTRTLLRVDPFSLDAAGRSWIDVHWLFQLGSYAVHDGAGLLGLVLVKAALLVCAALVLQRAVDHAGGSAVHWPFVVLFSSALFAIRHLLLVRPVIVTLVLASVFFLVLEAFRRGARARILLWLPLLQVVWANCQGLFGIGPALVLAYLAEAFVSALARERLTSSEKSSTYGSTPPVSPVGALALASKSNTNAAGRGARGASQLAGVFVLCALASFATPWGVRGPWLALQLLLRFDPSASNVYASDIAENAAPWLVERMLPGAFAHLSVFLALLATSFAAARKRLLLSHGLIASGLVILALLANRNVLLLYFLATPIVAINLAPTLTALRDQLRARGPAFVRAQAGALVLALLGLLVFEATAFAREPPLRLPTPFRFPTRSVAWLAGAAGGGGIFGADHQGGYVIWSLFPRFRPFMDTRLVLRTRDEYEDYLDVLVHPQRFDALRRSHGVTYALLPTAYPDRYLGLIQHLAHSPDWTLVFTDGSETLFAFHSAAPAVDPRNRITTLRLLAECAARYGPAASGLGAACRLNLATLDLALGATSEAELALTGLVQPAARALLARCRLADGDLSGAEATARGMLALDDEDPEGLTLLGAIELARGRPARALPWLRRALARDPFDQVALDLLARIEAAAH